jgi:putative transposase
MMYLSAHEGGEAMPGPKPKEIELTQRQRETLNHLIRRERSSQQLVRRVKIILAAADHRNNQHNADLLGMTPTTVRLWIERWNMASDILAKAEADENEKSLSVAICNVLADDTRPGRPAEFSPELFCQIIAVACENPEDLGRPISHWSQRELADEVLKRNLVDKISPRSVGRFLKRSRP